MFAGYISDDERPHTPRLEPVYVKYTPPRSPTSSAPRRRPMPDSESGGQQQQSRKRGRGPGGKRVQPSQGDVVLLNHLAPDRPDIAVFAGRKTFFSSESASEKGGTNDDDDSRMDEDEQRSVTEAKAAQSDDRRTQSERIAARSSAEPNPRAESTIDSEMTDAPPGPDDTNTEASASNRNGLRSDATNTSSLNQNEYHSMRAPYSRDDGLFNPANDTEARNPFKRKAPITLPHIADVSPSLQTIATVPYPERRSSPQVTMTPTGHLPSVQHMLREAEKQDQAASHSQRPRTASLSSVQSTYAPNSAASYSVVSPNSTTSTQFTHISKNAQSPLPSLVPLGRTATDPTPLPQPNPVLRHVTTNPADFAMHNSQAQSVMYAASSARSTSTAGATPGSMTDAPTPSDRSSTLSLPLSPERAAHQLAPSQITAGSGGTTMYRCTHPGCRAQPFQTPYLLNSHRNVHSSDRPYFCPRKDCPRSQPGKGFKRKNEMLRHGLVHDSPGYVCPFCSPEKEHRYPRPDNLQRHVKMHHEDIDPEDPRLREVLGQRRMTVGSGAPGLSNSIAAGSSKHAEVATFSSGSSGPSSGGAGGRNHELPAHATVPSPNGREYQPSGAEQGSSTITQKAKPRKSPGGHGGER